MSVVLDTSFLIDLAREKPAAVDAWRRLLEAGHGFLVPSPVLAEYMAGSKEPDEDLDRIRKGAEIAPLGEPEALAAAAIARRGLREGKFLGWTDVLIAGIAKERGEVAVVTGNPSHFPYSEVVTY